MSKLLDIRNIVPSNGYVFFDVIIENEPISSMFHGKTTTIKCVRKPGGIDNWVHIDDGKGDSYLEINGLCSDAGKAIETHARKHGIDELIQTYGRF